MSKKLLKGEVSFSFYFLLDDQEKDRQSRIVDLFRKALNDALEKESKSKVIISSKQVNDIFDITPSFDKKVYDVDNDNIFLPEAYELGLGRSYSDDLNIFFESARGSFVKNQSED